MVALPTQKLTMCRAESIPQLVVLVVPVELVVPVKLVALVELVVLVVPVVQVALVVPVVPVLRTPINSVQSR